MSVLVIAIATIVVGIASHLLNPPVRGYFDIPPALEERAQGEKGRVPDHSV